MLGGCNWWEATSAGGLKGSLCCKGTMSGGCDAGKGVRMQRYNVTSSNIRSQVGWSNFLSVFIPNSVNP